MRGLFVGRFQPFHNGHLYIIQKALEEVDELVVVIGSAECSFTSKDPYTAGERFEMINAVMRNLGLLDRVKIIPIRDVNRFSIWVDHVLSYIPRIDVVFTNNGLTETLFKEKGFEVRGTELVDRSELSGVVIREKMVEDEKWGSLVPASVEAVLMEIGGPDRLKRLSRKGDRP